MVQYAQAAGTGTTITIPMNTPITGGDHLVQKQPTTGVMGAQIPLWGLPPKIHGRIAVTAYDAANYLWTYEILEGDSTTPVENGAPGKALTACMKMFVDVGGDIVNPGAGWNYNSDGAGAITKTQMANRVIAGNPGKRVERIRYTQVNGAGDKQFYYKVQPDGFGNDGRDRGGIAILDPNWDFATQGAQIVYTYHGPFNFQSSPWFYVPTGGTTTTMTPILEVWSMYKYSEFCPSKFRKNSKWARWVQFWDTALYPPTPANNDALQNGIAALMNNGNSGCISQDAQEGQVWRPTNVDQFQFSVI